MRAAVLLVMLFMVIGMIALAVVGVKKLAGLFEKENRLAFNKLSRLKKKIKQKSRKKRA